MNFFNFFNFSENGGRTNYECEPIDRHPNLMFLTPEEGEPLHILPYPALSLPPDTSQQKRPFGLYVLPIRLGRGRGRVRRRRGEYRGVPGDPRSGSDAPYGVGAGRGG